MNKHFAPLFIALISTLLITACGWHLRGIQALPEDLRSLYIGAEDAHGDLVTDLKKIVSSYDISLADSSMEADYSLIILKERNERRTISVGNDALASEYELTLSADYRIERGGELVLPTTTASISRAYDHDPNDALSTNEEERLLREEMRIALIQQIIRSLRFAKPATKQPAAG